MFGNYLENYNGYLALVIIYRFRERSRFGNPAQIIEQQNLVVTARISGLHKFRFDTAGNELSEVEPLTLAAIFFRTGDENNAPTWAKRRFSKGLEQAKWAKAAKSLEGLASCNAVVWAASQPLSAEVNKFWALLFLAIFLRQI